MFLLKADIIVIGIFLVYGFQNNLGTLVVTKNTRMQILFFSDFKSNRLTYIVKHIFKNMLGFDVSFTQNPNDFTSFHGLKVCYSHSKFTECIYITPHGMLFDGEIHKQSFEVLRWQNMPVFFLTNRNADIPFDIFAASFYLISRYEEYLQFEPDEHGRFKAEDSLAFKEEFLTIPLVDLWVKELSKIIESKYQMAKPNSASFCFIPTIDIDNAFAYKHKGFRRFLLSTGKSICNLRFGEAIRRLLVNLHALPDPFDTYSSIFHLFRNIPQAKFFVLGGKLSKFDRHVSMHNSSMRTLLKQIAEKYEVGIHPSYGSGTSMEKVRSELNALQEVLAKEVSISRQHFLKIAIPQTYKLLYSLGIQTDYSMGYSNAIGFRASTCTPFRFYDLVDEKELPLKIVPFQVMDRALLQGLGLSANEAVSQTLSMAQKVKEVNGTFSLVWHNESLSGIYEWKGWGQVLDRVVSGIAELSTK